MSRDEYLDEHGKFKPKNKGGGRPRNPRPQDFESIVEPIYQELIVNACELQGISDESKLSPNAKVLLKCWRISMIRVEMLSLSTKPEDKKLLLGYIASARQSLKDALDAAAKEKKIEKDKGKDGKKPIGMY